MKKKENYTEPFVEVTTLGIAFTVLDTLSGGGDFQGWNGDGDPVGPPELARD